MQVLMCIEYPSLEMPGTEVGSYFEERISKEIALWQWQVYPVAILFLDRVTSHAFYQN